MEFDTEEIEFLRQQLRKAREQQGLTQNELAARLGCSRQTVWRLETDTSAVLAVSVQRLARWARILGFELSLAIRRG